MIPATLFHRLPEASRIAPRVDGVFHGLLLAAALVIAVLLALNLWLLLRYREGSKVRRTALPLATWKIETAWTLGTTAVFLGFFWWGASIYLTLHHDPANAYEISFVGRQWMWDTRHPDGRREFNEIHLPAGRPIRLELSSEDVIHSVFIPAFRVKQDVVPGKVILITFEATQPGIYPLFCTQYCGTDHAAMIARVIVGTPAQHAAWLARGPGRPLVVAGAADGRRLFTRYGCAGCHEDKISPGHAPDLRRIWGQPRTLADGRKGVVDETYVSEAILRPDRARHPGYSAIMPTYDGAMPASDLLALVRYIKALAGHSAGLPADAKEAQP
jgi:cytochrome c oxidase subunit 2